MAVIKLTRGFETTVDDDLYEELSQFKWYAQGNDGRPARRLRYGRRPIIFMYHQILGIRPDQLNGMEVDHINRDPLDNRIANLRLVSHQDNMRNSVTSLNAKGVSIDRTHGTWKAYVDRENGRINIGTFKSKEEATTARLTFLKED